ncbi:MAG: phage tail protein [Candidatus Methylomirabilales bacterium]
MPEIKDPLRNFRFLVEIEGIIEGGFSEASGFSSESDVIEYREDKDPTHVRKLSGLTKAGDITLKWGLTNDTTLFDWRQDIVDGKIKDSRKTVYIRVQDDEGIEQARWQCLRAWPSKLEVPTFDAKGTDVAINALTITCEEVKRAK